jgi:type IV pilus assembly protein PilM
MAAVDIPRIACEIAAERVIAARANDAGTAIDVLSTRTLPAGALVPGLGTANVVNASVVRDAVADALNAVSGRSREVIAILPDSSVRIVLLDFDSLPDKQHEADPVVRFRLKKSLPFDIEDSALSYDTHRANGTVRVVAAVTPTAVREEYENIFRNAGFNPGVVVPSMLSALGPVDAVEPTLILKVDSNTTSVAIVKGGDLLLYRTLENARTGAVSSEALADDIYPSLVFFQDTYGSNVGKILLAGLASAREVGPALESQTGARVSDLVSGSQAGQGNLPPSLTAPVVGALIGTGG